MDLPCPAHAFARLCAGRRAPSAAAWPLAPALALALALPWPSPATAADAVVGPANCNEAGFVAALGQVQSTGGGTITFNCGATPVTIPFTAYRQISSSVTIDGADRIVFDGGNTQAFFQVFNGASLDLRRLTLRRGTANGANPLENFGQLRLTGVTAEDNLASVVLNYGTATITRGRFIGNRAPARGAAIDNDGGSLLVLDSDFQDNVVNAGNFPGTGGALYSNGTAAGQASIRHSRFQGNRAFDGGAAYVGAGSTGVRFEHSRFIANQAGYGGAIESLGTATTVAHGLLQGNQAQVGDGGAIWSLEGTLFVQSSQFSANTAATTGGAISVYGNVVNVYNSAFDGNQSGSHGGALYSVGSMLTGNSTFHANTASGPASGGGAIAQAGTPSGFVFYSTLSGNSAGYGAGIASEGAGSSSVQVFGSLLAGNTGGNCAGVLSSTGWNLSDDSNCGGAFTATGDANAIALPLQPYGDYGGPTPTRPPPAGSPAINRIPAANCPLALFPDDQRGGLRPAGGNCDSGAVEVGAVIDGVFADGFD